MSVDAISSIMPELVSAAMGNVGPGAGPGMASGMGTGGMANVTTPAVSVYDVSSFRASMNDPATAPSSVSPAEASQVAVPSGSVTESEGMRNFMEALGKLNGRAEGLEAKAESFLASGREMTPSDMLKLTVESHEFMFHCEITANVANRTSDGIQQLFRQQS